MGSAANAKIRSGEQLPDVAGTELRRMLSAETGHVLVTLGPVPAVPELPGVRQVLMADTDAALAVADDERPITAYRELTAAVG